MYALTNLQCAQGIVSLLCVLQLLFELFRVNTSIHVSV